MPTEEPRKFGCGKCYDAPAEAFWSDWRGAVEVARLIDESHFIVQVRACPHCGQQYVSVTTEMIDWKDGEDPIYRSILPLMAEESEHLISKGSNVDVRWIESLGKDRRHLRTDWPKGEKLQAVYWTSAPVLIGPHD